MPWSKFSGSFLQQDIVAPQSATRHYRPDIDGLKAIAVLSVIITHYFKTLLPGGFVGVDIFFIISGYLIARSTFLEIHAGKYLVSRYFQRRVKRIFPSLIVVLIAVLALGWLVLLPNEFERVGKHIAGASVFISNWQFWREVGYFDTAAELKPLLNLWSLGVEEQFYLLFPLLIIGSIRGRRGAFTVMLIVLVVSLISSLARVTHHAGWAYFHLFSRLWELLLGSLFAYVELSRMHARFRDPAQHRQREETIWQIIPEQWQTLSSCLGFVAILASITLIDKSMPFPAPTGLLPTVGALLLIASGPGALVNRVVLSHKVLIYIGLISYPLYLWHWPLISLTRIVDQADPTTAMKFAMIAMTFVLSALCYHFIERPIRFGRSSSAVAVPMTLVACMAVVGFSGLAVFKSYGVPTRIDRLDSFGQPPLPDRVAVPGDFKSSRKVALIGDSHASMYESALRSHFFQQGLQVVSYIRAGCRPFWNLDQHSPGHSPQGCPENVNQGIEAVLADASVETVVIVARLNRPTHLIHPDQATLPASLQRGATTEEDHSFAVLRLAANQTLEKLLAKGKRVIMFTNIAEFEFSLNACQARPLRLNSRAMEPCAISNSDVGRNLAKQRQFAAQLTHDFPTLKIFDPLPFLCNAQACNARHEGKFIYWNTTHLNELGADLVMKGFAIQFSNFP